MVGHPGNAPGISWSQARRIAFFLMPEESGGPCGLRSHDLPADNRVLCWTELTNLQNGSGASGGICTRNLPGKSRLLCR